MVEGRNDGVCRQTLLFGVEGECLGRGEVHLDRPVLSEVLQSENMFFFLGFRRGDTSTVLAHWRTFNLYLLASYPPEPRFRVQPPQLFFSCKNSIYPSFFYSQCHYMI